MFILYLCSRTYSKPSFPAISRAVPDSPSPYSDSATGWDCSDKLVSGSIAVILAGDLR